MGAMAQLVDRGPCWYQNCLGAGGESQLSMASGRALFRRSIDIARTWRHLGADGHFNGAGHSVIGLALAIARLSANGLARSLSGTYIWVFRGTPLLVQWIFWYNMSTLFPHIGFAFPWEKEAHLWNTNDLISPLTAAIAGLALNEAAYMAEVIRAGLLSVDSKQMETAQAFGMSRTRALWRIVIPQARRSIIPPTANQLISMIKATSLVSVIAMSDLLYAAQTIYNRTFEVVPLLIVAVVWYLLVTSILNMFQKILERRFSRGHVSNGTTGKGNA